jgi:hypothetical protein
VVLGFLAAAIVMRRSRCRPAISLAGLAVVQLVGFALTEMLGTVVHDTPATAALSPHSLVALALQVPVALVVFRLCQRAVAVVARLIGDRDAAPVAPSAAPVVAPATVHRPAILHWTLASGRRGPPTGRLVPV